MTSFSKPTSDQIKEAVPLLSSPQHEAYFFSRLENPLWIVPLTERNVFKYPPPAEKVVPFPSWPPSRYLARMAALLPGEVADLFAEMDTDNESIVGDMLNAANAMQSADAVALVPAVCRMAEKGRLGIHFKGASELCMRLIAGGDVDAAIQLAKALFTPRFEEEKLRGHDEHWYKEGIKQIAPALSRVQGPQFLPVLCDWLDGFVGVTKHVDSGSDYSYSWRPAIEEHEQNYDFDLVSVIVGVVREAFEQAIRNGAISLNDAIAVTDRHSFLVFGRLGLHLVGVFAQQQPELARSVMLNRELFDDYEYKHEYAMLMGRRWEMLSREQQTEWLSWIDQGPDMSNDDEDRQGRIRWWQYERYHWIHEHLNGERQTFYKQMLREHGKPEMADLNVCYKSVRWGHESPMTVEQLAGLTFD